MKQSEILKRVSKAKKEIEQEREPICEGCGTNQRLSPSHLISRQDCRNEGHIEWQWDKENIRVHCMNGCHEKWESRNLEIILSMNDGQKNIDYVRKNSETLYQKIMR